MFDRGGQPRLTMSERTHYLTIKGMTCGCCSGRINRVLKANPNVLDTMITFESEQGAVLTTDALTTDEVVNMVASAGFAVSA